MNSLLQAYTNMKNDDNNINEPVVVESYHALVRNEVFPLLSGVGGNLLDVGGGVGATASEAKKRGFVERAGVVDLVQASHPAAALDFSYQGDIEDELFVAELGRKEGPFDVILCLDILEHLRDPWALISRLHNLLRDDGVIVASIPNIRCYKAWVPLVFCNKWTLTDAGLLDRTHLRFFVRSTAIELMTSSGLTLQEVRANPLAARRIKFIRAVTFGCLNSFMDLQYLVKVKNSPSVAPVRSLD